MEPNKLKIDVDFADVDLLIKKLKEANSLADELASKTKFIPDSH